MFLFFPGMGAMAAVDTIVNQILSCLQTSEQKSTSIDEASGQATSPESVFHWLLLID